MFVVMMTLFALVVVGYVAGKLGYLGGDFDRQLSRLVINITCPALILSSAMTGQLPDRQFILRCCSLASSPMCCWPQQPSCCHVSSQSVKLTRELSASP
jgi:predicted permease